MGVNYNFQNITVDNLKEFENRLIMEFDGTVPYVQYIENEKIGWFELLEKISKEMFPKIDDSLNQFYRNINLPFFVLRNIQIPNFMDNSQLHSSRLLDVKLDLEFRIDQLIKFSCGNSHLLELTDVYLGILENIGIYINKSHLYQCNYTYCQIILDREVERIKYENGLESRNRNKKSVPKTDIHLNEICINENAYKMIIEFLTIKNVIKHDNNSFGTKVSIKDFVGFLKSLYSKGYLKNKLKNSDVESICKNTFKLDTTYNTVIQAKETDTSLVIEQL